MICSLSDCNKSAEYKAMTTFEIEYDLCQDHFEWVDEFVGIKSLHRIGAPDCPWSNYEIQSR